MKKLFMLLLLAGFYCYAQRPELALTQKEFDDFNCCWRKLSSEKHYAEAAAMLEDYVEHSPNAERKHPLNWHTGQLYAHAGDNRKAVKYMRKTYNIFYRWFGGEDGQAWYYYAKGTVAFLEGNKRQLERIISLWKSTGVEENENFAKLHKLLSNFDKTYTEAY